MAGVLIKHVTGAACVADAGYDADAIVNAIRARKMKAVIASNPTRKRKRPKDRKLYSRRYLIECFFHFAKRFRALATRYEKTATSYLAMVHVVCILAWLN